MAGGQKSVKVVILVGGPQKGTRFRPLSLEVPKPLFPVAGVPLIQHHIESCKKVEGLSEIILLGYYHSNEHISKFINEMQKKFSVPVRYLQEYKQLGTAGGLYHFRDQIQAGDPEAIIVIHSDIFCVIPLVEMLKFHREKNAEEPGRQTVLGTKAAPTQTSDLGNMVVNFDTMEIRHYVEKPESYVSSVVNCGVYIFHPTVFQSLAEAFQRNIQLLREELENPPPSPDFLMTGKDLLSYLAADEKLYVYLMQNSFWGSMKSAGSAIYANRQYLSSYRKYYRERLMQNGEGQPLIEGDVYIHPTAVVDCTAKIGPNVTIGRDCIIGPGARVRQSIILDGAELKAHSCVLYSIIGWRCLVGSWARVEGTPHEPSPDFPHALVSNESLFHADGKLVPSITVLGCNVIIPREVIILNTIVLPHKELGSSYKNEIIL